MAYAATAEITDKRGKGVKRHFTVTVDETEAATASEWSVSGLPRQCRIVRFRAAKTAGSGSTIQTRLGQEAGWTDGDIDELDFIDTAAGTIFAKSVLYLDLPDGVLYGRSSVDSGADNTIKTKMSFVEGWD